METYRVELIRMIFEVFNEIVNVCIELQIICLKTNVFVDFLKLDKKELFITVSIIKE